MDAENDGGDGGDGGDRDGSYLLRMVGWMTKRALRRCFWQGNYGHVKEQQATFHICLRYILSDSNLCGPILFFFFSFLFFIFFFPLSRFTCVVTE